MSEPITDFERTLYIQRLECDLAATVVQRDLNHEQWKLIKQENALLEKELADLKSHDHAPCVLCDPLRQELASLKGQLEESLASFTYADKSARQLYLQVRSAEQELAALHGFLAAAKPEILVLAEQREHIHALEDALLYISKPTALRKKFLHKSEKVIYLAMIDEMATTAYKALHPVSTDCVPEDNESE